MPKMIQIRHVPDALHRRLKVRAAEEGLTLSDYLRREIESIAAYPSNEEILARFAALKTVRSEESSVAIVQAGREERDAHLDVVRREAAERDAAERARG